MFNTRFPGRRIAAASACAALLSVAAPAIVPADPTMPFGAPAASANDRSEEKPSTKPTKDGKEGKADKAGKNGKAGKDGKATTQAIPEPTTDVGREIKARMDEATDTVTDKGGLIGLAFLDRETGELVCNDRCTDSFALASLAKVFVAEVVGYTNYERPGASGEIVAGKGDMPVEGNTDAMARDAAMRYSDNDATTMLWRGYGGTKVIDSVKERYGLSDATIATPDWGSTQSSAADMAKFFDGLLSREGGMSEVETRYLVQLMYSLPRYSSGSADQNIGLRAALPDEFIGVKGGWVDPKIRTSGGFFGEDERYVMVALSHHVSPEDFTEAIAHVFPEGGTGIEERGDEAIQQAAAAALPAPATPSNGVWPIALLLAAAGAFALGWFLRRTPA